MKRQIVIIHGGHAYDPNEDFVVRLRNKVVTALDFKVRPDWKDNLIKVFSNDFEVFFPTMPNKHQAKYEEWRIWFERMIDFMKDDSVLIGHSLGGLFLVKYLSENIFPRRINTLILVAAPYDGMNSKHARNTNFYVTKDLHNVSEQVEEVYIYHSKDDKVVPFSDFDEYQKRLPNAHGIVFEDRGHFNIETFPELIDVINKLS